MGKKELEICKKFDSCGRHCPHFHINHITGKNECDLFNE